MGGKRGDWFCSFGVNRQYPGALGVYGDNMCFQQSILNLQTLLKLKYVFFRANGIVVCIAISGKKNHFLKDFHAPLNDYFCHLNGFTIGFL